MTISQKTLKELFDYDPSGQLIWKVRSSPRAGPGDVAGYWDPTSGGYFRLGIYGKIYRLHRVIYAWHTGQWPEIVDHRDRDTTNNRIGNLREVDWFESARNRRSTRR